MIKILVYDTGSFDGVSWWRNTLPLSILRTQYATQIEFQYSHNPTVSDILQADVVLMFRPTSDNALKIAESIKKFQTQKPVYLLCDLDDDLWNLPYYHFAASGYRRHFRRMREIYDMADMVWVSTEQLRYSVGDLGRAIKIPNAVLPGNLPDKPAPYKGIACWRGSTAQFSDITAPFAQEWYKNWRDKYERWRFWGYWPNLEHGKNVDFVDYDGVLDFFASLGSTGANVFWKPLEENKFNDAKSSIAWMEATMAGGVCVTNYAGKEGWEMALSEFTTEPETIESIWRQSKDWILEHYNLLEVNRKRFESIVRMIGGATQTA